MDKHRPIQRSRIRIAAGKTYYSLARHLLWLRTGSRLANKISVQSLPFKIASHQTPLRRNLRAVDSELDDRKIKNLSIAIKTIDGIIIKPGQVFSYWKLIGKPTRRRGYVEGMVLDYGKFTTGVGGGLCQLSNLIFWMLLHSPLTVTERHRHSHDVFPDVNRTQPFGSGATCVYNYRDLQCVNETEDDYQIRLWLDEHFLHGEIRSSGEKYFNYEIYESAHQITLAYWGGYIRKNAISRRVRDMSGKLLDDGELFTNEAVMMYSPLLSPPQSFCEDES